MSNRFIRLGQEDENRCIRSLSQSSAINVLELPPRLLLQNGRLSTILEKEGPLHISTLELIPKVLKRIKRTDEERGSSDTTLEEPILVPDDFKNESPAQQYRLGSATRGDLCMNEDLTTHLNKAIEQYEQAYEALNVLDQQASVLRILYPQQKLIAEDTDIVQFLKAKRRQEISIPSEKKLETWDADILVEYILKKMSSSEDLTLYDLQQKKILLLYLHTMWRPRSDTDRLQYRDVR
ncbi:hypothetical protein BY458DRAFT_556388 [Sporodiniella umbellata]|nr:hypothetical protein BY458DRAFT_556388 [Sporodiniella umbellata]